MKNIMVLYNDLSTDYICNLLGMYGYDKEIIKREYFDSLIRVPFEDRYFLIMREYDECLTNLYGDYMRLPPENKRITHGYLHIYFNG